MGKSSAKFDYSEFNHFVKKFDPNAKRLTPYLVNLLERQAWDVASRAEKNTPVDTGYLRSNWHVTPVRTSKETMEVTIYNDANYASFIEYGHYQEPGRYVPAIGKRLVNDWVDGKFMLTDATNQSDKNFKKRTETTLRRYMREMFK